MKRVIAGLTAVVTGLGLSTVVASPAQAYIDCSTEYICFYDGFLGALKLINHSKYNRGTCYPTGAARANRISSVDNMHAGSHDIRVYVNSSTCTGLSAIIYANTQGNMSGTWNNSIDSFYVY